LTDNSGLFGWWTKNLEGTGAVGSISTFRFKSGAFNKMKIKSLKQDKVEWECVGGHEEWKGTKITFELHSDGDQTKLCFSHFGWKNQSEYVGECSFIWANYLLSLQKFCETGYGTPDNGA
jgi:hypothetical protein